MILPGCIAIRAVTTFYRRTTIVITVWNERFVFQSRRTTQSRCFFRLLVRTSASDSCAAAIPTPPDVRFRVRSRHASSSFRPSRNGNSVPFPEVRGAGRSRSADVRRGPSISGADRFWIAVFSFLFFFFARTVKRFLGRRKLSRDPSRRACTGRVVINQARRTYVDGSAASGRSLENRRDLSAVHSPAPWTLNRGPSNGGPAQMSGRHAGLR